MARQPALPARALPPPALAAAPPSDPSPPPACALLPAQASKKGLTSEEVAKRLEEYGYNKLPEESRNAFLVYLSVSRPRPCTCTCTCTRRQPSSTSPPALMGASKPLPPPCWLDTPASRAGACPACPPACLPPAPRHARSPSLPPAPPPRPRPPAPHPLCTIPAPPICTAAPYRPSVPPLRTAPQYMWNPLSWAMEAAAIIAIALLDYADFALIVALLFVNATISYVEEANADKAIKALTSGERPGRGRPRTGGERAGGEREEGRGRGKRRGGRGRVRMWRVGRESATPQQAAEEGAGETGALPKHCRSIRGAASLPSLPPCRSLILRSPCPSLPAALAPKAKALRDGQVQTIDASNLVPGDICIIRLVSLSSFRNLLSAAPLSLRARCVAAWGLAAVALPRQPAGTGGWLADPVPRVLLCGYASLFAGRHRACRHQDPGRGGQLRQARGRDAPAGGRPRAACAAAAAAVWRGGVLEGHGWLRKCPAAQSWRCCRCGGARHPRLPACLPARLPHPAHSRHAARCAPHLPCILILLAPAVRPSRADWRVAPCQEVHRGRRLCGWVGPRGPVVWPVRPCLVGCAPASRLPACLPTPPGRAPAPRLALCTPLPAASPPHAPPPTHPTYHHPTRRLHHQAGRAPLRGVRHRHADLLRPRRRAAGLRQPGPPACLPASLPSCQPACQSACPPAYLRLRAAPGPGSLQLRGGPGQLSASPRRPLAFIFFSVPACWLDALPHLSLCPPSSPAPLLWFPQEANLQKVMTRIGAMCLVTIGVWIVIELAVQFGHYNHECTGGAGERLRSSARRAFVFCPCARPGTRAAGMVPAAGSPRRRSRSRQNAPCWAPAPCVPLPLTRLRAQYVAPPPRAPAAGGCPTLTNMLVIVVGGIPIAMHTVLSVTLALGAFVLAKEGAIVSRMSGGWVGWLGVVVAAACEIGGVPAQGNLLAGWRSQQAAPRQPSARHPAPLPPPPCPSATSHPFHPALSPPLPCPPTLPCHLPAACSCGGDGGHGHPVLRQDRHPHPQQADRGPRQLLPAVRPLDRGGGRLGWLGKGLGGWLGGWLGRWGWRGLGGWDFGAMAADHAARPYRLTVPQVLKYGAMSANIVTEEPIDMVLHESYPNRWVGGRDA